MQWEWGDSDTAVGGTETIDTGYAQRSLFVQTPRFVKTHRSLRMFGALAAAAALAVTLWPSPKEPHPGHSADRAAGNVATATESVQLELPYSCGVLRTTPVLPTRPSFLQARAGLCTGPASGLFPVSAQIEPSAQDDPYGSDLVLTMDPIVHTSAMRTHWHFDALGTGCVVPAPGSNGLNAIEVTTRAGGAPAPDGSGGQQLTVFLRPELMARMAQASCPPQNRTGPR
ncbi:MAG: hypothetical protein HOV87_05385 [Catenulispora sp.]|nr:hypothetical protein [Catenulispora sp.]